MNFNDFLPTDFKGWVYMVLVFVLLIVLFFFNKAIMKCKENIESYVFEIRQLKDNGRDMGQFIVFVSDNTTVLKDYAEAACNSTETELLKKWGIKDNA